MSPEAKAADHVYRQLKLEVMAGDYPPSTILNVQQIASEIGVSISPVRDAIERLVGERLVSSRSGGGFQVPTPDENSLRDLYFWHGNLARWAVSSGRVIHLPEAFNFERPEPGIRDDEAIVEATRAFYSAIGTATESAEHVHALQSAGERLHAARRHEGTVVKNRRSELAHLFELAKPGRESQLRDAISRYHWRRARAIPRLLQEILGR